MQTTKEKTRLAEFIARRELSPFAEHVDKYKAKKKSRILDGAVAFLCVPMFLVWIFAWLALHNDSSVPPLIHLFRNFGYGAFPFLFILHYGIYRSVILFGTMRDDRSFDETVNSLVKLPDQELLDKHAAIESKRALDIEAILIKVFTLLYVILFLWHVALLLVSDDDGNWAKGIYRSVTSSANCEILNVNELEDNNISVAINNTGGAGEVYIGIKNSKLGKRDYDGETAIVNQGQHEFILKGESGGVRKADIKCNP